MSSQIAENYSTRIIVEEIIDKLQHLTLKGDHVDGETMQYILQKVGMEDQMLRQLMMSRPFGEVHYMFNERCKLENS